MGFPMISTFCNFDPIAKRLCFSGVYAQDLAKRWEEAADAVVLESPATFLGTPMSSRKLLRVRMNFPTWALGATLTKVTECRKRNQG